MYDLRIVALHWLVALDGVEVVEEVLDVHDEVDGEVFDRLLGLDDLLDLFAGEVLGDLRLHRHDLVPHIDDAESETEREVDEEDGGSELEQAELVEIQVEQVALILLLLWSLASRCLCM